MTSPYFRPLLVSAALAVASLGASAQPAGGPPPDGKGKSHMVRPDPARMQERMEKRQAELKAKLELSPGQEAAWNTFVQAARPPAPAQGLTPAQRKQRHEEFAAMTTPQRIDQMQARKAERDAEMARRAEATKSFYAVLTPAQQKIFDQNTLPGPRHGGPRHGPRGSHHQG